MSDLQKQQMAPEHSLYFSPIINTFNTAQFFFTFLNNICYSFLKKSSYLIQLKRTH